MEELIVDCFAGGGKLQLSASRRTGTSTNYIYATKWTGFIWIS